MTGQNQCHMARSTYCERCLRSPTARAAVSSGMLVTIPEIDFGPLTPANINDTDFDDSTGELPPSKPLHEWTDSLAQVTLAKSLPHRIRVMILVRAVPAF